jgi:hypothetical protein
MKYFIKKSINSIFLSIIGLSIPYLEFIKKNLAQVDYVILKDTTTVFFISFIVLVITFLTLKKKFRNNHDLIVVFSCCHYLFYKFSSLKYFFIENKVFFDGELSVVIIILSILFIFFLRKKEFIIKFIKFYIIFYFFLIVVLASANYLKNSYYKNDIKISNSEQNKNPLNSYFNQFEINEIKNKKNKNIYLVLFDAMTSLEEFDYQNSELNFNLEETYKNLSNLKLNYIKNSKSAFTTSYLTFSSIFNLKPIVTVDSPRYKDRSNFFPTNLLEKNSENYPFLLNTLKSINYKFKWVGTPWAECVKYDETFCLSYDNETKKNNLEIFYKLNPNNNYVFDYFMNLTFIKPIVFNFRKILFNEKKYFQWEYRTNDGIGKFLDSVKFLKNFQQNNFFFFIHHMAPHWPYVYNQDCSERIDDSHIENNFLGYKESYLCSLKKIKQLMNYINSNDPDAIVIIQGDHGFEFDQTGNLKISGFSKKNAIKRLTHFNSMKVNKSCQKYLSNNIGNVNGVRLALSCATNTTPKLIKEKHLVGYYETSKENYGLVKNLDDLE